MDFQANAFRSFGINNILLVSLIVVAGSGWSYLMFGRGGGSAVDKQEYVQLIEARLADNAPAIEAEAKQLAADILPPVGQSLYREARQEYPRYLRTLQSQGDVFGENVQKLFIQAVQAQYRDYLRKHRRVLAEEFPNHANEESLDKMLSEFERLADQLVERYYLDELLREGERTAQYWSGFEPLDPPATGEPSLEEQLADYLADWSVLAFTDQARQQVVTD